MSHSFERQLFRAMLNAIHAGVLVEDSGRRIAMVNPQFCEMFSIEAPAEALVGADCSGAAEQSKHLFRDPDGFVSRIVNVLAAREEVRSDLLETVDGRFLERDYLPLFVGDSYEGHMWVYRDITERESLHRRVRELAIRDEMTGLYNRRGFLEVAQQQLLHGCRLSEPWYVMALDMDGLKQINDALGHAEGDRALCDLAGVLRSTLRAADVVARLGGDEFAALLCGAAGAEDVQRRLHAALDSFNTTQSRPYLLEVSLGFAPCHHGANLEDLLSAADAEMYGIKRQHKRRSMRASMPST